MGLPYKSKQGKTLPPSPLVANHIPPLPWWEGDTLQPSRFVLREIEVRTGGIRKRITLPLIPSHQGRGDWYGGRGLG